MTIENLSSSGKSEDIVTQQRLKGQRSWREMHTALATSHLSAAVDDAGRAVTAALRSGKKILLAGNGGSAAMASHIAAEFAGRCIQERRPLPAISLAESSAIITAIGNDYGLDQIFSRGVRALGRPGDVLIVMTTSGTSANILEALASAHDAGVQTIALTGESGLPQGVIADHVLAVPSNYTPRIQEMHLLWNHVWCEAVDLIAATEAW